MRTARACAFYALATAWTVVLGAIYLPLFVAPKRYVQNCGAFYSRGVLVILRLTTGVRQQVRGRENLPPPPYILASKHQSAWETFALPTVVDRPAIVLRRNLYRIPVLGWYLRAAGMIAIDRAGRAAALRQMLVEAKAAVADARPILIFPEGTRIAPGAHRPLHVGIAALYDALKIPVVPVAVNSGLYWPRGSLAKRPGRIVLEILPPLPAGLPRAALTKRLHAAINEASDRLVDEACARDPRLRADVVARDDSDTS